MYGMGNIILIPQSKPTFEYFSNHADQSDSSGGQHSQMDPSDEAIQSEEFDQSDHQTNKLNQSGDLDQFDELNQSGELNQLNGINQPHYDELKQAGCLLPLPSPDQYTPCTNQISCLNSLLRPVPGLEWNLENLPDLPFRGLLKVMIQVSTAEFFSR